MVVVREGTGWARQARPGQARPASQARPTERITEGGEGRRDGRGGEKVGEGRGGEGGRGGASTNRWEPGGKDVAIGVNF